MPSISKDTVLRVKEFKKILNRYPEHLPMVLSSDSEGNSFSLLHFWELSNAHYLDNSDVTNVMGNEVEGVLVLYPRR